MRLQNSPADQKPTIKFGIDRSGSVSKDLFFCTTKALPLSCDKAFLVGAGTGLEKSDLSSCGTQFCLLAHFAHTKSTAAPFVPPFIFRRKRSAQNKLFARHRAQETRRFSDTQNSDTCIA